MSTEVRRQKKLEIAEKKYFIRRGELLEKYIVKMLYKWNNRKFKKKYLRKLEKIDRGRSLFLWRRNLKEKR